MKKARYVGVDVRMPDHPRVVVLDDAAFRAFVSMLCYCGQFLTDGAVPGSVAIRWPQAAVDKLVEEQHITVQGDGYFITHYLDWNPSKAEVEAVRAAKAAAGRQGGLAKRVAQAPARARARAGAKRAPQQVEEHMSKHTSSPVPVPKGLGVKVVKPSRTGAPKGPPRARARMKGTSITTDQAYLLGRLYDRDTDPKAAAAHTWHSLTPGGVVKLNQRFGVAIVHAALQRLHEERDTVPTGGGYSLLASVCTAVQAKTGGAG